MPVAAAGRSAAGWAARVAGPQQVGSLYARVGADASPFHRTMGGVRSSLHAGSQSFSVFGRAGSSAFALIAAGGAAIGVLKGAVSAAADFQSTVAQLGVQTNQGAVGMARMSARAIKLGADVRLPGTSASDAAEAMLELAKGGQKMGDVMKSVRGVLVASAAGEMSNADAANTVVGALGAFNLKASESVRVANLLAGGANASTASMQDMAFSLQMGGSAANAAHVPIQTFVAMTAEMANAGIKGADAGTSLKQMFLALTPTSKKANEAIDKFGLSAFDAHHAMLPMPEIIAKYHKALAGMSDQQRISTLKTIFGSDAYRAANIIFGQGAGKLAKLTGEVSKQGQAAKLAAAKNSGMKGVIDGVKSSWNTFQVVLGERVAPAVKIVGTRLSNLLGDVTKLIQPTKDATSAMQGLGKGVAGPPQPAPPVGSQQMHLVVPATPPGFAAGLEAAVRRAFSGIDWTKIGAEASSGFTKGLSTIGDHIDGIINTVVNGFARHRSQIAEIGAQMVVAIGLKLADPSFWIKNWDLAIGVALAVGPGKFLKLGGKLGEFLLKPFAGLGEKLGGLMSSAVLSAAEKAGGTLGKAVLNVGAWVSKAGPDALSAAVKLGGKVVTGAMDGISKLGFKMRAFLYTVVVNVIGDAATAAYNAAMGLGGQIVDGAVAGVGRLYGALKSKLESIIGSVLGGLNIPGMSPVDHAAKQAIGDKIVNGAIKGVSDGAARGGEATTAMATKMLNAAKAAVDARKSSLQSAFSQLGQDIGAAFDAGTQRGLSKIGSRFDKLRADATSVGANRTPSEQALYNLQSTHDASARAQDIADAQASLATATASGDGAAIVSAQKALNDLLYNEQVAALQAKADTERTAADQATADQTARYDTEQAQAELEYQAKRDLQKRHLDAMLLNLQTELAKHPGEWKKINRQISEWFKKTGSPDLQEAGKNLGLAFAAGLAESKTDVNKAAHSLALEVQKFLKLNSPADQGPLASLDSWWTAMPKTLLSGLDGRELGAVADGIASPGLGAAMAASGGGGGDTYYITVPVTVQGSMIKSDELGPIVRDAILRIQRHNPNSGIR